MCYLNGRGVTTTQPRSNNNIRENIYFSMDRTTAMHNHRTASPDACRKLPEGSVEFKSVLKDLSVEDLRKAGKVRFDDDESRESMTGSEERLHFRSKAARDICSRALGSSYPEYMKKLSTSSLPSSPEIVRRRMGVHKTQYSSSESLEQLVDAFPAMHLRGPSHLGALATPPRRRRATMGSKPQQLQLP